MTVIDCRGSGRERGLAHGEAVRPLIAETIARWEQATLRSDSSSTSIREYATDFLARTSILTTAQRRFPDLVEELQGIADGAGVPFEVIVAYNLMDEQWWYDLEREAWPEPGCTVLARRGAAGTMLAQNMDLPTFMNGSQVVLRVRAPGHPESLILSSAGMIGLTGVNRAGVAVCVNALLMLRPNPAGLPVAVLVRAALGEPTAAHAAALLRSLTHASGQHYAVADRHGVTGLECSGSGCALSHSPDDPMLVHTNHPLASDDIDDAVSAMLHHNGGVADSELRLAFGEKRVEDLSRMDSAIALLSDPSTPICMRTSLQRPSETFGSVLYSLSDDPTAAFCLGVPGQAAWQTVRFADEVEPPDTADSVGLGVQPASK
jgi:isopenicillin-N N-acyltransferase like protein